MICVVMAHKSHTRHNGEEPLYALFLFKLRRGRSALYVKKSTWGGEQNLPGSPSYLPVCHYFKEFSSSPAATPEVSQAGRKFLKATEHREVKRERGQTANLLERKP